MRQGRGGQSREGQARQTRGQWWLHQDSWLPCSFAPDLTPTIPLPPLGCWPPSPRLHLHPRNSVSHVSGTEGTLADLHICGRFASPNVSQIPCQAGGWGRVLGGQAREQRRCDVVRGYGTEVRKSPHGDGGSREVLRLNGKERSPRETDTGRLAEGQGSPGVAAAWQRGSSMRAAITGRDGAPGGRQRGGGAWVPPGWGWSP